MPEEPIDHTHETCGLDHVMLHVVLKIFLFAGACNKIEGESNR